MTTRKPIAAAMLLAVLPAVSGAGSAKAPPGVLIDSVTERVLLDACAMLRSAQHFSVKADITWDDVLESGIGVQYSRHSDVLLERPNRLRIDSVSDKGERSFYYDGKTFALHQRDNLVYAEADAPASIDALLDTVEARGIVLPFDDLLRAQPCAALGEHLKTGAYAGRHFVDGEWAHHLLLETDAVDVQMWVATGEQPVIRKMVITYRDDPGVPQFTALLRDWRFTPSADVTAFTFTPPPGVRKVEWRPETGPQGGAQ